MQRMKKTTCHCCNGSGEEIDQGVTGMEMRTLRKSAGLSLKQIGGKIRLSCPYLSDLERGKRNWNTDLIDLYKKACK